MGQGIFYLSTGVWPILHMESFEKISGPKAEHWLVKTVGALVAVSGAVLISSAKRNQVSREIAALGLGQAAALAAIDLIYASIGRISMVYLLDAGAELVFAANWLAAYNRNGFWADSPARG